MDESIAIVKGQRAYVSYGCDDLVLAGRVVAINAAPDEDDLVDVKLFYRAKINKHLLTVISQPPPMPELVDDEEECR